MTTINSPGDLKTALKNKEHEILFHGRNVYIVYSKKDFQDAVNKKFSYIYPGNKRMEKALPIVEENQDKAFKMGTTNGVISETTIVALSTLVVILVLGILAIVLNGDLELKRQPDGTYILKTRKRK